MVIDSDRVTRNSLIQSDLCIIGAGAAGITMAREFLNSNVSVCLLESGTFQIDHPTQMLYHGKHEGDLIDDEIWYLVDSRVRYFGGSTNHWSGKCRPLDEIDFDKRSWVSYSGWPITRKELDSYYQRACPICDIILDEELPSSQVTPDRRLKIRKNFGFANKTFYSSKPTRFGEKYREEIVGSNSISLYLNANVTNIASHPDGKKIEFVDIQTLSGNRFSVKSRYFILAAGGIENARILLFSNQVYKGGLGNHNDLVGRFFLENPGAYYARAFLWNPINTKTRFSREAGTKPVVGSDHILWPTEPTQREYKLLNSCVKIKEIPPQSRISADELRVSRTMFDLDSSLYDEKVGKRDEVYVARLNFRSEQGPNPDSRVILTNDKDALGKPKIKLNWKLNPQDYDNVEKFMGLISHTLSRHYVGRVRILADEQNPWPEGSGASHHMGTTRMHDDPKKGVVDKNCGVHGISNLFMAGSSVFPTGSFINPTLTIVALALRLSDHIKGLLIQ